MPSEPNRVEQALEQGIRAARAGRLVEALELFSRALPLARDLGDHQLWDRIFCNKSAVEIELGRTTDNLPELRLIVLRSTDAETAFLAAYNSARAYELQDDPERALFYARIARDRSTRLGRADWQAWSQNQIANLELARSSFREAAETYQQALALQAPQPSVERAQILDNLGYCRLVQGQLALGFAPLFEALRMLRRLAAERAQAQVHISLAFGYLELERYRSAWKHARRALALGEQNNDPTAVKNAHYLLGEALLELGDEDGASEHFSALQAYYPQVPHLARLLLTVDVRPLLNLKA